MRRLQALAMRLALAGLAALSLGAVMVVASLLQSSGTPAFADSAPYELFCPATPVGNIVLNNVVTTGTITPASPTVGEPFQLTSYQSMVPIPSSIVSAAAAVGTSAIVGTATLKVDATGATPTTVTAPQIPIDAVIPSPVPSTSLTLSLPSSPASLGPFMASGGTISLTVDPTVSIELVVSGSNLVLTCNPYPNNSAVAGIVTGPPTAAEVSPVIVVASPSSGTTTTTLAPSTTTVAPTTTTTRSTTTSTTSATPTSTTTSTTSATPTSTTTSTTSAAPTSTTTSTTSAAPTSTTITNPSTTTTSAGSTTTSPSTTTTSAGSTTTNPSTTTSLGQGTSTTTTTGPAQSSTTTTTAALSWCGAPPNPYGFTYCPHAGSLIYHPPSDICSFFNCIPNFPNGKGYMVECNDGTVSLAGGLAGACSDHGGVRLPVYDSGTVTSITTRTSSDQVVTASSGELAFTGPGSGLKTATIVGAVLMLVGIVMLLLSDPRRLVSQLASLRLGSWADRRDPAPYINAAMSGREYVAGRRQRERLFVHEAGQGATPSESLPPDPFGNHGEQSGAEEDVSVPARNGEAAGDSDRTHEVTPGLRVLRIIPGHPTPVPGGPAGFNGDFFAAAEAPSSATMDTNDRSGWWLASDGEWYPPEQRPSYPDAVAYAEERQALPHIDQETGAGSPPAAWYDDPLTSGLRYWDGSRWTEHVAYRRDTSQSPGSSSGDDGGSTGSIDEIQARHAEPRRDHVGGPEIPGWWLRPGSE